MLWSCLPNFLCEGGSWLGNIVSSTRTLKYVHYETLSTWDAFIENVFNRLPYPSLLRWHLNTALYAAVPSTIVPAREEMEVEWLDRDQCSRQQGNQRRTPPLLQFTAHHKVIDDRGPCKSSFGGNFAQSTLVQRFVAVPKETTKCEIFFLKDQWSRGPALVRLPAS